MKKPAGLPYFKRNTAELPEGYRKPVKRRRKAAAVPAQAGIVVQSKSKPVIRRRTPRDRLQPLRIKNEYIPRNADWCEINGQKLRQDVFFGEVVGRKYIPGQLSGGEGCSATLYDFGGGGCGGDGGCDGGGGDGGCDGGCGGCACDSGCDGGGGCSAGCEGACGGSWGDSGSYSAEGMNATGDVGAWAGTAYDASTEGTGAGAGGDWGSFGATSYSGMNAPNPDFSDIGMYGATTGGGDWGSAGAFSAAGTGGGPGGAMLGDSFGGGGCNVGGCSMYGDPGGGGLFGGYEGGGCGGCYGGGGGGGKGGGGGGFSGTSGGGGGGKGGSSGGGTSGGGKGTSGYTTSVSGGKDVTPSEVSSPYADDTAVSEQEGPEAPTAAPEADPDAAPLGTPSTPTSEPEAEPESGPAQTSQQQDAPQTETSAPSTSAFGPQSLSYDYQGSPYADLGPQGTPDYQGYDYSGSPYADMGQQQSSQAYTDAMQALSGLTQTGLDPQQADFWGSVFEAPAQAPVDVGKWSDLPGVYYTGISNWLANTFPTPGWAQNTPDVSVLGTPGAWLAPGNRGVVDYIANNPNFWAGPVTNDPSFWGSAFDVQALGEQGRAGQQTDLSAQLGIQDIAQTQGLDPGAEQYGTEAYAQDLASQLGIEDVGAQQQAPTDWASVFEAPAQDPDWASVFEAPAQDPDWASVFEGTPSSPDWTSVFEGQPSVDPETAMPGIEAYITGGRETDFEYADPNAPVTAEPPAEPTYDTMMESGPAGQQPSDDTATLGGDPALSGASVDAAAAAAAAALGAPGAPGAPGAAPGGAPQQGGPTFAAEAAVNAVANAASNAALDVGAPTAAMDAASQAAYNSALNLESPTAQAVAAMAAALEFGATQQQADAIAAAVLAAANSQPAFTPGAPGQQQQAPAAPDQPGAPTGPEAPSTTSSIAGGRTSDFNYQSQAPASPAPSLLDMAQPGMQAFVPGGRETDFNYPSSTSVGIEPGAEQYGVEVDDDDAPEPTDTSQPPQDPNAPRPPGNVPGQVIGARGTYTNSHLDNPQVNTNYRNSGRTDYPQGRPGIDFRSARQAGIQPLFRIEDINVHDVDARLVGNINRALQAMEQRTGIPANSLVATSGWRPAHRGEAHEHVMDERASQESVYSRYNPNGRNVGPAARPGGSNHGPGRAIDFSPRGDSGRALAWLRANAREFDVEHLGFKNGKPFDLPHIQLRGASGNVGARPSAQEQAGQRALDAQNRQAAIDLGLIAPGRGQAPAQQAARPAAPPGGWRGIGSDRADIPWLAPAPQPDVPLPTALPPPDVPLPPEPAPAPRPPAEIPAPAPFLAPPARGRADPKWQAERAQSILKQATAGLNKDSGQAAFQAASVVAAKALAAAGIPLDMARSLMTKGALDGAIANGYGPGGPNSTVMGFSIWGKVQSAIAEGVNAALQGYNPGATGPTPQGGRYGPGEVQGPFGFQPAAPAVAARAEGGPVRKGQPYLVGEEGPEYFVPDRPGTVFPHIPQSGKPGNVDRWPKVPAPEYPGRYGGLEREIRRQTRAVQDPVPSLMDMIDSGHLRLNAANWQRMLTDPSLIELGRSRIEDRRYRDDYPY